MELTNGMNQNELTLNLDKLHTTELGVVRIKRNLALVEDDVVHVCREMIQSPNSFTTKKGKNRYVNINDCEITINAHSFTIITAHRRKNGVPGAVANAKEQ